MKTIVSVIPVEDEDKRLLEQAAPGCFLRSRGKSRPTACATRR